MVKELKKIGRKTDDDSRIKRNDSRSKILEASWDLFREQGYEKTTTRQILQRSGVLNGSLYYAFGNKEGIFKAIAMDAFRAALSESEKQFEKNSNIMTALSIPGAIELYAAASSKHIAELLYHGNNSWTIMNGIKDIIEGWMTEQVEKIDRDYVLMDCDRNILAIMAVIGKYVEEYYKTDNNVPLRKNLRVVMVTTCALFGLSMDDIETSVEEVASYVEAADLTIIGSEIKFDADR